MRNGSPTKPGGAGFGQTGRLHEKGAQDYHIMIIYFHYNTVIPVTFLSFEGTNSGVRFCPDSLASPRCEAGVTHNVLAPRSFRSEVFLHGRSGPCRFFY